MQYLKINRSDKKCNFFWRANDDKTFKTTIQSKAEKIFRYFQTKLPENTLEDAFF